MVYISITEMDILIKADNIILFNILVNSLTIEMLIGISFLFFFFFSFRLYYFDRRIKITQSKNWDWLMCRDTFQCSSISPFFGPSVRLNSISFWEQFHLGTFLWKLSWMFFQFVLFDLHLFLLFFLLLFRISLSFIGLADIFVDIQWGFLFLWSILFLFQEEAPTAVFQINF